MTPAPRLPKEVASFKEAKLKPKDEREQLFTALQKVRLHDAKLKFWARIVIGFLLSGLLLWQNVQVFSLVWGSFASGHLPELTTILSIIVPATLAETAAVVHTMVKWIFKDTDYERHE